MLPSRPQWPAYAGAKGRWQENIHGLTEGWLVARTPPNFPRDPTPLVIPLCSLGGGEAWGGDRQTLLPPGPAIRDQGTSKTPDPSSLPRTHAGQPDGGYHLRRVSAAVLVCDIYPPVLHLGPALAPEADGRLRGTRCLGGARVGPTGTAYMSGTATAAASAGTQRDSSGLWSSPGRGQWGRFLY